MFKSMKAVAALDAIRAELDLYMESGSKDAARAAKVRFGEQIDVFYLNGDISERTFKKYRLIYGEYCSKMKGLGF